MNHSFKDNLSPLQLKRIDATFISDLQVTNDGVDHLIEDEFNISVYELELTGELMIKPQLEKNPIVIASIPYQETKESRSYALIQQTNLKTISALNRTKKCELCGSPAQNGTYIITSSGVGNNITSTWFGDECSETLYKLAHYAFEENTAEITASIL